MKLTSYGLSDIGLSRNNNEDVWIALPECKFFALADGMGGHLGGEIAAKETVEYLVRSIKKMQTQDCLEMMIELRHAIEKANHHVHILGKKDKSLNGMGTTLCCILWSKEHVIFAHVGDSRIYRFRDQKLQLLTQDHSLFAKWLKTGKEASTPFPYKNVITRSIGTSAKVEPEITYAPYSPNDLYFLCSDGLTDVLNAAEIEKIIQASDSLETASKRLIEQAKKKGSTDNITIVMIQ